VPAQNTGLEPKKDLQGFRHHHQNLQKHH
jgi:hypothetical protein